MQRIGTVLLSLPFDDDDENCNILAACWPLPDILPPARKRTVVILLSLPFNNDNDDSANNKKMDSRKIFTVAFWKAVDASPLKLLLMLECP